MFLIILQVPSALESFPHTCLWIVHKKNITSKSRSKIAQTSLRHLPWMTKCCVHPMQNKACTDLLHRVFSAWFWVTTHHIRGDVKILKMWSPTCRWSWQQVVTEKSVTSDTLIVVSHHSWAAKSWCQLVTITHQFQGPSAAFSGEFWRLPFKGKGCPCGACGWCLSGDDHFSQSDTTLRPPDLSTDLFYIKTNTINIDNFLWCLYHYLIMRRMH